MEVKDEEVLKLLAARVVESLGPEQMKALLQPALVEVISSWEVKRAVEDEIAEKAREVAREIASSQGFQAKLRRQVYNLFKDCSSIIAAAVIATFLKSFGAKERYPDVLGQTVKDGFAAKGEEQSDEST